MSATVLDRAEWERRFVKAFADRMEAAGAPREEAEELARCDLEGAGYDFASDGFEGDPEAAAAEALSHYVDDEDDDVEEEGA